MTLRVVVATDAVGTLDPLQAGVALARGWAAGAQVAVVPLAGSGLALAAALAALLDGEPDVDRGRWRVRAPDTVAVGVVDPAQAADLREWLEASLRQVPRRLIVDLTAAEAVDGIDAMIAGPGGAGAIADGSAIGAAVNWLAGLRARLEGIELIGVVPPEQAQWKLLGLQGAVVRRGYGEGRETADILAAETAMAGWLAELGIADAPGAGAGGGAGAVVLALGGRVVGGTELCAELAGLSGTIAAADVVVTGCTSFDIGTRGGTAVPFVAEAATAAQRPCLVFAVESTLSRREMRTFGVEAAYAVGPGPLPEALTAIAQRVATGWTGSLESRVH